MTGLDLLSAIRERDPDLPVILVTGNPTAQVEEQSVAYGAFKYVVKPLSPFELCETVGEAVRCYRVALLKRAKISHSEGHPSKST
jgi:two-component system C4-dicarboxylate transport response regulator DctD